MRLDPAEHKVPNDSYTLGPIQAGEPCCIPKTLFSIKNLSLHYGTKPALKNVSLDIYEGCITALIGPSGCGKTSFLSTLNRLTDMLPDCKVTGDIQFNGNDLRDPSVDVLGLRRDIGMIFQKPVPFLLSIRRNIELPLREHGITKQSEVDSIVQQVLQDVGLWEEVKDRLESSALALSGGQQQRLCIARALALKPKVLLMDEPCSALDPISSAVVEDLITSLRGRYTVIIVTHNLAQAKRIANYAGFFWVSDRAGCLIEFGQCKQVFEAPVHELTAAYVDGSRG
ncbi:phosphate ABC transporter ATP-binding protein [methanotrophic endosymbiont of Bathymodiolus puteoserpentis (Logatchev)]|uniref:phosphate ABC transporter ATP-binding protein n=1 Tax=methanotrophic endosymbiont of Bathymodiolus puteoserpentis (Logatchev) TaxID=343235 RepID=UPI00157B02BC|nr:phosphate ABC transporter ATP-binding protein [methanotrophic endosymbiont of Bathymodiolus puteoserpentis (Logatchev)]